MLPYSKYFIVEFLGIVITLVCAAYVYLKYVAFNYWSSRKIAFVEPIVPFGSLWPVFSGKLSLGEFFRDKYLELKRNPVFGVYGFHKPKLVINDPDLIRIVLTKEFASFHDRGTYCNEKVDPLSCHIVAVCGAKWKYLRAKFSPTFTSSKMKQMFFIMKECSETLTAYMTAKVKKPELVEVKDLMARFTTDVVASAAFGIQCNSIENPDAEFRKWGRKVFVPSPLKNIVIGFMPELAKLLHVSVIDKNVSKFFFNAFKETVAYRTANNVERKDFLNLAMQLMSKGSVHEDDDDEPEKRADIDDKRITMMEAAAQAFIFWTAGFETSSSTATFCLYELALHQDIQDQVADEINTVLAEFGGLTYESLRAMSYLHKVVSETMRKYPSLPRLNRECTRAFDLPGTGLRVEVGTPIVIPVFGLHMDPDFYPDPKKFDPERFNEQNIASRHPYTYLPFGEGPRNCIGVRFGMVQTKVGLLSLLSKFRFTPGPDLRVPLQFDKGVVVSTAAGGITLRVEKR